MHHGLSECSCKLHGHTITMSSEIPLNSQSKKGDIVSANYCMMRNGCSQRVPSGYTFLHCKLTVNLICIPSVTQFSGLCSLLDVLGEKKKKRRKCLE